MLKELGRHKGNVAMSKKGKLFYGGIPTGPDVERLMMLDISPGDSIEYAVIENTISVSRKDSRFYTVTRVWREQLLRDRRLHVVPCGGAFRALTPNEAISERIRGMHRIGRAAGREVRKVELIDLHALSDNELYQHRLIQRSARALLAAAQKACERIAPPSTYQSYRKLAPPPPEE